MFLLVHITVQVLADLTVYMEEGKDNTNMTRFRTIHQNAEESRHERVSSQQTLPLQERDTLSSHECSYLEQVTSHIAVGNNS